MGTIRNTLLLLLLAATSCAFAQTKTMLVYGPTAGCHAETTAGFTVTVWDTATWASKSTDDFSAFDVIVFGDCPICTLGDTRFATAISTLSTWAPAVTGNIAVIGSDIDYHYSRSATLLHRLVEFCADDPKPGPGLYYAVGCAYHSAPATLLPLTGTYWPITVVGASGDRIHKVADHPILSGITDADLSSWSIAAHEGFPSFPPSFIPLAINLDAASKPYTATDGTVGLPHILVTGDLVVPLYTFTPTPTGSYTPTFTVTPTPTDTFTPTVTPTITPTFTPTCALHAWPNPFVPELAVRGTFKVNCMPPGGTLLIYTVSGEKVVEARASGGIAEWDGRNEKGRRVSGGVYYWLARRGGDEDARGKVIVTSTD